MPAALVHSGSQKSERLVTRVSPEDKMIISQAAAISGQSVGSSILSEARKAAIETLETRQRILLSARQSQQLVDALLTEPHSPLTDRMKGALKRYRRTVVSDAND